MYDRYSHHDSVVTFVFYLPLECLGYTDLTFIVDRSARISEYGFKQVKKFISQTVRLFPFANGETKVSMVTYANIPTAHFDFNNYKTLDEIQQGIDKAIYTSGTPKLHKVHINLQIITITIY